MSLFSDLTNIYDQDLDNIQDMEVYNFINRNKDKIDAVEEDIVNKQNKRISELEEKIELKEHMIEFLENQKNILYKDYMSLRESIKQTQLDWVEADRKLELAKNYVIDLQQENAKLQEHLKKAPKFNCGDTFYCLGEFNICKSKVLQIIFYKDRLSYVNENGVHFECNYGEEREQGLFATEAEARKCLESLKNDQ